MEPSSFPNLFTRLVYERYKNNEPPNTILDIKGHFHKDFPEGSGIWHDFLKIVILEIDWDWLDRILFPKLENA